MWHISVSLVEFIVSWSTCKLFMWNWSFQNLISFEKEVVMKLPDLCLKKYIFRAYTRSVLIGLAYFRCQINTAYIYLDVFIYSSLCLGWPRDPLGRAVMCCWVEGRPERLLNLLPPRPNPGLEEGNAWKIFPPFAFYDVEVCLFLLQCP